MVSDHIVRVDVLNFLEKADYNIFLALTGVRYRSFPHLSSYKVLRIHLGVLPGKLLLSLPLAFAPLPIPGPCLQAFRIRSHREGKFFIGVK